MPARGNCARQLAVDNHGGADAGPRGLLLRDCCDSTNLRVLSAPREAICLANGMLCALQMMRRDRHPGITFLENGLAQKNCMVQRVRHCEHCRGCEDRHMVTSRWFVLRHVR